MVSRSTRALGAPQSCSWMLKAGAHYLSSYACKAGRTLNVSALLRRTLQGRKLGTSARPRVWVPHSNLSHVLLPLRWLPVPPGWQSCCQRSTKTPDTAKEPQVVLSHSCPLYLWSGIPTPQHYLISIFIWHPGIYWGICTSRQFPHSCQNAHAFLQKLIYERWYHMDAQSRGKKPNVPSRSELFGIMEHRLSMNRGYWKYKLLQVVHSWFWSPGVGYHCLSYEINILDIRRIHKIRTKIKNVVPGRWLDQFCDVERPETLGLPKIVHGWCDFLLGMWGMV